VLLLESHELSEPALPLRLILVELKAGRLQQLHPGGVRGGVFNLGFSRFQSCGKWSTEQQPYLLEAHHSCLLYEFLQSTRSTTIKKGHAQIKDTYHSAL
jgi:hypothetical protein